MGMICYFLATTEEEYRTLVEYPETVMEWLYPDEFEHQHSLDIDKAWHGLHFLLTGEAWDAQPPLNFILSGGTILEGSNDDYGPARFYSAAEVRELSKALEPVTEEVLRSRFDPAKFKTEEIYPDIWNEPVELCFDEYLLEYFEQMKVFFKKISEKDQGMIVHIN